MNKKDKAITKTKFSQLTQRPSYIKIKTFLDKNSYILCSFIIPFALLWMIYILLRVYPFGSNSVLVLDLNGQYVYFFEALRKAIFGDASLLYSWSRSLGGEFMGIYAYYIASPLSYIVALFPESSMTEALLTILLLKCGLCGGTMSYYLHKKRPNANEMITITVASMYALCSYAVVQAHNTMWIDALIWLPLIVYGIEQLITHHKFKLLVVSLSLCVLSNFYIGYMVCIFVMLYFFYFYFSGSNKNNNAYGESCHFVKSLLRMVCAAVASLLIACIILLPTFYSLSFGKTDFSNPSWKLSSKFDIIEFISKLFIGSYDTVRPEGLPFVYCGILALILVPLYFISKKVSLREKIGGFAILGVLLISMETSVIDLVWHGFQAPNWLNYRYSFLFIFIMLVLSHRALEEIKSIKSIYVGVVSAGLLLLLLLVQMNHYDYFDTFYSLWLSIILIVVYTALLILIIANRFSEKIKSVMITVLSIVVCLEMWGGGALNTYLLDDDVTYSPRNTSPATWLEGYNNYLSRFRPIINGVLESDTSFYRMEKTDVRKACDNHALLLRGVTGSTSTLNADTIAFLNRLGYVSKSHWSKYKGGTAVADSLLGIKYIIYNDKQENNDLYSLYSQYNYTASGEEKSLYAYLNRNALSLAYTSSDDILDFNLYDYTSPFDMLNAMVTALLGSDETVEIYKKIDVTEMTYDKDTTEMSKGNYVEKTYDKEGNPIEKLDSDGNVVYKDGKVEYVTHLAHYLTFTALNENVSKVDGDTTEQDKEKDKIRGKIHYNITLPEGFDTNTEVLMFFPTNYTRTAKWTCGDLSGTLFENDTDCIQSIGYYSAGDSFTFDVTMTSDIFYVNDSCGIFYYVDEELFEQSMQTLAEGNYQITDYSETHFEGSITATENETTVFTSIPYDEGWNIYVDGVKVEPIKTCDALIAFDLGSAGEHSLELKYWPKQLTYGMCLTAAGIVFFIGWIILDKKIFSQKRLELKNELEYELERKKRKEERAFERQKRFEEKKAAKKKK